MPSAIGVHMRFLYPLRMGKMDTTNPRREMEATQVKSKINLF